MIKFEVQEQKLVKCVTNEKVVTVPNNVEIICSDAFSTATSIRELTLGEGIKEAQENFLSGLINLERLNLRNPFKCPAKWGIKNLDNLVVELSEDWFILGEECTRENLKQYLGYGNAINFIGKFAYQYQYLSLVVGMSLDQQHCHFIVNDRHYTFDDITYYFYFHAAEVIANPQLKSTLRDCAGKDSLALKNVIELIDNFTGEEEELPFPLHYHGSTKLEELVLESITEETLRDCSEDLGFVHFTKGLACRINFDCPLTITSLTFAMHEANIYEVNFNEDVVVDDLSVNLNLVDLEVLRFKGNVTPKNLNFVDTFTYLEEVELPKNTVSVKGFDQCEALREIKFPETLQVIRQDSFNDCISLEKLELPKSFKRLDGHSFNYAYSLREIIIKGEGVYIGSGCFCNCRAIKRMILGKNTVVSRLQEFPISRLEFLQVGDVTLGEFEIETLDSYIKNNTIKTNNLSEIIASLFSERLVLESKSEEITVDELY